MKRPLADFAADTLGGTPLDELEDEFLGAASLEEAPRAGSDNGNKASEHEASSLRLAVRRDDAVPNDASVKHQRRLQRARHRR